MDKQLIIIRRVTIQERLGTIIFYKRNKDILIDSKRKLERFRRLLKYICKVRHNLEGYEVDFIYTEIGQSQIYDFI